MEDFNWFGWMSDKVVEHNIHIVTGTFVALLLITLSFLYNRSLKAASEEVVPTGKFSLKNIFQYAVESLLSLMEGIIGHEARDYFPLVGGLFIYIFVSNLIGAIPGFIPPTENVNTNFACSITVFLYYNYLGVKKQGAKNYFKHFMGPVAWLAWLMLPIELISHIVRPVTLSLRLLINMFGDHLVLGVFSGLVPLIIPVIFMALGVFVAFIQAFVFSLLSTVYIGLAVAHEEGHH